jgi:hypothetical protein
VGGIKSSSTLYESRHPLARRGGRWGDPVRIKSSSTLYESRPVQALPTSLAQEDQEQLDALRVETHGSRAARRSTSRDMNMALSAKNQEQLDALRVETWRCSRPTSRVEPRVLVPRSPLGDLCEHRDERIVEKRSGQPSIESHLTPRLHVLHAGLPARPRQEMHNKRGDESRTV